MIIMRRNRADLADQDGGVLVLVAVWLVPALLFVAMAVDYGLMFERQRRIQNATDAAVLAGALALAETAGSDAQKISAGVAAASEIAAANGLNIATESQGISAGNWDLEAGIFQANVAPFNAVQMHARRVVPTIFARLIGQLSFEPKVESIAVASTGGSNGTDGCLRPIAFEAPFLIGPPGIEEGQDFCVGPDSPGNWGKVDLPDENGDPINMSSGRNFENAMNNGVCGSPVVAGDELGAGTGFGGSIAQVFQDLIQSGLVEWPALVVSEFGNGNSSPVNLDSFVRVRLNSFTGRGNNYNACFTLLDWIPGGNGLPPGMRNIERWLVR